MDRRKTFTEVAKRWESASPRTVTWEQCFALLQSADFYPCPSYIWEGQPAFIDGEIGYDDVSGNRIIVPEQPLNQGTAANQ